MGMALGIRVPIWQPCVYVCRLKRCAEFTKLSGQTSFYRVVFEPLSWHESAARCRQFHPRSHLVAIDTDSEYQALKAYLNALPGKITFDEASDADGTSRHRLSPLITSVVSVT